MKTTTAAAAASNHHHINKEPLHVCVIGAGVCGLVSVKACLEAGLRVTCFDKSSKYGGLWNYREAATSAGSDDDQEDEPSIMRTTILNTSKELSSFSDFPPPANLPNFMRHNLYMDYINSYVAHNKLLPHLELQHEILHVEPLLEMGTSRETTTNGFADHSATKTENKQQQQQQIRWLIRVRDLKRQTVREEKFDRLLIAVGHHNVPYEPKFPGQDKYRGKIIHSAKFKDILTDKRVVNKRVLIVGLGNSACDAAADLSLVAEKCYVSCHRGSWFINRLSADSFYDFKLKSRLYSQMAKWIPTKLGDRFVIKRLESRTNHKMLGLKPLHKPSEQVPSINDLFPYRILTGGIVLKSSVATFTETGAIFEGEPDQEYPIDLVILATGYKSRIPFLDEHSMGFKSAQTDQYELYLNMFAPHLRMQMNRNNNNSEQATLTEEQKQQLLTKSMAFIGLVQPSGSITVVSELQARYAAQIFLGQLELPPKPQMLQHIEKIHRHQAGAIRSHSRDQLIGDWVAYLDLIAEKLGAKPNLSKLFFKDFQLWKQLIFGPSVPYQYRLDGPNKWSKARETILSVDDRIYQGINEGKNHLLFQTRRKCLNESTSTTTTDKSKHKTMPANEEKKLQ